MLHNTHYTCINAGRGRLALPAQNVQCIPFLCLHNGPVDSVVCNVISTLNQTMSHVTYPAQCNLVPALSARRAREADDKGTASAIRRINWSRCADNADGLRAHCCCIKNANSPVVLFLLSAGCATTVEGATNIQRVVGSHAVGTCGGAKSCASDLVPSS